MLSIPPIPSICITPAPPEELHPEPYSPIPTAKLDAEDDGYRANRLSLPPSLTNRTSPWHSSPLRPANCPPHKGLSRDQFNSLLKVSRDQRAKLGTHKVPDLRKELALKSQSKQFERRAHFLSKVEEPSFTATLSISVIPPESPTTARCSISSPGFEAEFSPLEVEVAAEYMEDLVAVNSPANSGCDEQVERGLLIARQPLTSSKLPPTVPKESRRISPTLDEITAHLMPIRASFRKDSSPSRLPSFLKAPSSSPGSNGDQIKTFPVRSLALNDEKFDTTFAQQVVHTQRPDPCSLKLGSRHAVIPHTVNVAAGPTLHTSRADTARDMILTLKRRRSPPVTSHRERTRTSIEVKRRSVLAELGGRVAVSWGSL